MTSTVGRKQIRSATAHVGVLDRATRKLRNTDEIVALNERVSLVEAQLGAEVPPPSPTPSTITDVQNSAVGTSILVDSTVPPF